MTDPAFIARAKAHARPGGALTERYANRGDHVDCYAIDLAGAVAIDGLIAAFFSARAFQPERWFLKAIGKPSVPADWRALASGVRDDFAAWSVEERAADQILLCDYLKATRCWLMIEPFSSLSPTHTRLYFGSVVTRRKAAGDSRSPLFSALLPLHGAYSKILLNSAAARLRTSSSRS